MKVKVKGMGWLNMGGRGELLVELGDEVSVGDALREAYSGDQRVSDRLFERGGVSRDVIVLLNGVDAEICGGLGARLRDEDVITVVPVVHGG